MLSAHPETEADLEEIMAYARENRAAVIPYGGGTSVIGHINPSTGEQPVLSVDMSRMDKMLALDSTSRMATFEAGVAGPKLEEQLKAKGVHTGAFSPEL